MDNNVVLMGRRHDGAIPMIEVMPRDAPEAMAARAETFLKEHLGCDSVELWLADECMASLSRTDSVGELAEDIVQAGLAP